MICHPERNEGSRVVRNVAFSMGFFISFRMTKKFCETRLIKLSSTAKYGKITINKHLIFNLQKLMPTKTHKEHFNATKLNTVISISFFIALEAALLAYIYSSFLKQYLDTQSLGYVFAAGNFIAAIIYFRLASWVSEFGRYKVFLISLSIHLLSLIGLILFSHIILAIFFFLLYTITLMTTYVGLDIFTETFSCDQETGGIKGRQLTIQSLAWVVAPAISGYLLAAYGFNILFVFAGIITLIAMVVFFNLKDDYEQDHVTIDLKKSIKKIRKNKNLFNIIMASLWLMMFFAVMVVYLPLYLIQTIGLDWSQVGLIFTIMLMSFLIFQYPAGHLADTKYGEKEILMFGFLITGITTTLIFFIDSTTVWVWAVALFATRIGACLVQIMTETYFFKQIDSRDVDLINLFRLARPVAYMITPLLVSILLIFYSLNYIFLFLGIFMLAGLWFAGQIEDTK